MTTLSTLKRFASYSLLFLPMACLKQEVNPIPDQTTRGCLIREKVDYSVESGNSWQLRTQHFDYNLEGNPISRKFIDNKRNITKIHTMEYDGLRLTRINLYEGNAETSANLTYYKTLAISDDFKTIIEHTFQRIGTNTYIEVLTRVQEFFRNEAGSLKLSKTELVSSGARPDSIGWRSGTYWRLEYDDKK